MEHNLQTTCACKYYYLWTVTFRVHVLFNIIHGLPPSDCMSLSIIFMNCHLQTACACQLYSWTVTYRLHVLVNYIHELSPTDCMCLSIIFMNCHLQTACVPTDCMHLSIMVHAYGPSYFSALLTTSLTPPTCLLYSLLTTLLAWTPTLTFLHSSHVSKTSLLNYRTGS